MIAVYVIIAGLTKTVLGPILMRLTHINTPLWGFFLEWEHVQEPQRLMKSEN